MSDRKTACAGCGKVRADDLYSKELVEVEVYVGESVKVCRGRTASDPSAACLVKARADKCPGCGGRIEFQSGVNHPSMCSPCKRKLALGAEMLASGETERRWTLINARAFFGDVFVGHEDGDVQKRCLQALCAAVGGRTYRDASEGYNTRGLVPTPKKDPYGTPQADVRIETTAAQHDGLVEFQKLLGEVSRAIRRKAFRDGDDLLGRLARGERTVNDYSSASEKGRTE